MDTDHFHGLMGFAVLEWKKLSAIMDGCSSRLGGVEFPLADLKVLEKTILGIFLPREHTTSGFQATLPDVHVTLWSF